MKQKNRYIACGVQCRGFTLIELLVVIGIIGMLVAILLPVVNKVMKKGESVRAKADVDSLVTAWTSYYNEYGKWPVDLGSGNKLRYLWNAGGSQDATENASTGIESDANTVQLLAPDTVTLSGNNMLKNYNPKGVQLLTYQQESLGTDRSMIDPWDQKYKFLFDLNGDGKVEMADGRIVYNSVAAWSCGPDGVDGTADEQKDDITSW